MAKFKRGKLIRTPAEAKDQYVVNDSYWKGILIKHSEYKILLKQLADATKKKDH